MQPKDNDPKSQKLPPPTLPKWARNIARENNQEKLKRKTTQQDETRAMLCYASSEKFYSSPEWKLFRVQILKQFESKCMACGAGAEKTPLHVDHIRPRSKFPERSFDEDNMQVLCEECNLGKSANMKLSFRATRLPFTMPELAPYLPDLPDSINALRSTAIQLKTLIENLTLDETDTLNVFGFVKAERKILINKLFLFIGTTHRAASLLANKEAAFKALDGK